MKNNYFNYQSDNRNDQRIFLETLYHDKYDGTIVSIYKDRDGQTRVNAGKRINVNSDTCDENCYTTINTFRNKNRKSDNLYNAGNLIIDIDFHNGKDKTKEVKRVLNDAFDKNKLPVPTISTYTGRGICLIYSLKRSIPAFSEKGILLYKKTYDRLFDAYDDILSKIGVKIDRSVKDIPRLIRKPGTFNLAVLDSGDINNAVCRIIAKSDKFYNLSELMVGKTHNVCRRTFVSNEDFVTKRIKLLNKLVKMRNGEMTGIRNQLLVAFTSVCSDEGKVFEFNNSFTEPLRESEVRSIIKSVSHKNGYKLTNQWLIDHLCLSKEEIDSLNLGIGLRNKKRKENRNKKEERDALIIKLAYQDELYDVIAEKCDCSVRTVKRVLDTAGYSRYVTNVTKNNKSVTNVTKNDNQKCQNRHYKVVNTKRVENGQGSNRLNLSDVHARIVDRVICNSVKALSKNTACSDFAAENLVDGFFVNDNPVRVCPTAPTVTGDNFAVNSS